MLGVPTVLPIWGLWSYFVISPGLLPTSMFSYISHLDSERLTSSIMTVGQLHPPATSQANWKWWKIVIPAKFAQISEMAETWSPVMDALSKPGKQKPGSFPYLKDSYWQTWWPGLYITNVGGLCTFAHPLTRIPYTFLWRWWKKIRRKTLFCVFPVMKNSAIRRSIIVISYWGWTRSFHTFKVM